MAKRAPAEELRELAANWRQVLADAASAEERIGIRARIVHPFFEALRGAYDPISRHELLEGLLTLHGIESLGRELLQELAEIAEDRADASMRRAVLEALLPELEGAEKVRLLERLAEVLDETGDKTGASERWKTAARARLAQGDDEGREEARRLHERVLEVVPTDFESVEELVRIHLERGAWERIPEVVSTALRADADRGAELLLSLEGRARETGGAALDAFLSIVDEAVALGRPTSDLTRRLRRARANALSGQSDRHEDASTSWRLLLDAFESPDDARDYEAFIASRSDETARHLDRRWLFAWRAARARGATVAEVLRDWAKSEIEHGETQEAIDVHRQWLEVAAEGERGAIRVALARLLAESGRAADAVEAIAPVLAATPPNAEAVELAHGLLSDDRTRASVVERVESVASGADDTTAARLLDFLIAARDHMGPMPEARRRWYRRATGIAGAAPPADVAIADAMDNIDDALLWEAAEQAARASGEVESVVRAYIDVLARDGLDAAIADALGRRFLALEPECAIELEALVATLEHVLARAPVTRWALDRIKIALGDEGHWDRLFPIWDRAIEAATNEAERDQLLDEATFLARDVAADPVRTTKYLAKIHARRPDDANITAALERAYERQSNKAELVVLLRERAARVEGGARRDLERRVVALLLDLGRVEDAREALRSLVVERAVIDDLVELLERVLRDVEDDHFAVRLRDHYVLARRLDDATRIVRAALARTKDGDLRVRWLRGLVRLGVDVEADAGDDPRLRRVARRAKLMAALAEWRRARTEGATAALVAANRAWAAFEGVKKLALDAGDARIAARLLERGTRLPFDAARRRELLLEAALLRADRLGDSKRAMRLFGDLFREDPTDAIADSAFDRYLALLEAARDPAKIAKLWEARATGDREADCLVRAGKIWETEEGEEDPRRAIDAYRRAADLDSAAAYEGLARLYVATWRWEEAIHALEWLLEHSPDDRPARVVQLADALVEVNKSDRARVLLRDTLASLGDGGHASTVRSRLLALLRREESWADLAAVLVEQAEHADARDRVVLLREAADVRLSKLDDRAEATRLLELAVAADPKDPTLRSKLADLLEAAGAWERVSQVLFAQVDLEADRAPREAAALRQRLAHALLRIDQIPEALEHLRIAAKLQPTDGRILLELGKLAVRTGDLDGAERAYRSLLLSQGNAASSSALVPRLTIYVQLAEISSRRGDAARAVNLLESALDAAIDASKGDVLARAAEARDLAEAWREHSGKDRDLGERIRTHAASIATELERERSSSSDGAWASLWSAYAALGDEETLLGIVRRHVDAMRRGELDREKWRGWLLEAAALSGRVGDVELSVRLHGVLLEDAPHDHEVWAALGRILDETKNRARLVPLLERAIAQLEGGVDRARLRVELATLLEARGDGSDAVMEQLTLAAADDPMNEEAVGRLSTMLEREGGFAQQAALLKTRLEALSWGDPRFIETAWRLGRALESAESWEEATRLYEDILDRLDREPTDRATARTLAHRLEALESSRLADALELWMRLDEGAARAVAPRIVELREALGDRVALERALESALRIDPAEPRLLDRLLRLKEEDGDGEGIASALRRAVDATPNDRQLLRRLITAQRVAVGDQANKDLLDELIAKQGDEPELLCLRAHAKEAIGDGDGAIEDLRKMGIPDRLLVNERIGTIRRVIAAKPPAEADELAMMLVDDLVFAGNPAEADSELHVVLGRNPEHVGALERFGALYVARREWARAQHTYAKLLAVVERTTNGADHDRLARVVGAFADACTRAGQPGDARQALERVWRVAPERQEIGESLERVCEVTKDRKRLAELVAARADRAGTVTAKATLLLEAAELLVREGDNAGALRTMEAARALDPANIDAALACGEQYLAQGRARDAITVLGDVVERNQRKRVATMALVYLALAKAHLVFDELVEALDALKAAFAIDVRTGELALLLGQTALDLGEMKVAERAFVAVTFASRMDGSGIAVSSATKASALYHLASIARVKGDLVTARRWAGKATMEDPSHARARALLEKLEDAGVRTPRSPAVS